MKPGNEPGKRRHIPLLGDDPELFVGARKNRTRYSGAVTYSKRRFSHSRPAAVILMMPHMSQEFFGYLSRRLRF
jgi:hypothetical protein